jgi:FMN phosphatase YigB (HAD superfamily)
MTAGDRPIRLVCFDLGGVILRICRSWAEGCAAAGLELRGGRDLLLQRADGWTELNDRYQRGRIGRDEYARRFSAIIDGLYGPAEIIAVHEAWILGEYEGIGGVIDRIHDAGLETAVLSNTTLDHWRTMPRYPALQRLRNRIGSHQLGLRKPEPDAYRAVEQRTGIHGEAILFFDDLEENIDGARAVGWRASLVDPAGDTAAQIAAALGEHGALT